MELRIIVVIIILFILFITIFHVTLISIIIIVYVVVVVQSAIRIGGTTYELECATVLLNGQVFLKPYRA